MMWSMNPNLPVDNEQRTDFDRDESSLEVKEENSQPSYEMPPMKRKKLQARSLKKPLMLILMVLVLVGLLVTGVVLVTRKSPPEPTPNTVVINTQSLDNGTLNQLTPDDSGETKQQLSISVDTIFKNDAVIQGSVQIVKKLSVQGGADIGGDTNLRGNLSVSGSINAGTNLTVNGLITAASLNVGSIAISTINITGSLSFEGHIIPGGPSAAARASNASGGGSVSISGNDTAGTITIKTGSGPVIGELAVINFRTSFNTTPKIQLTPVNEPASSLRYFATKTASLFTVNTGSAPASNTTYIFDYFVTQ